MAIARNAAFDWSVSCYNCAWPMTPVHSGLFPFINGVCTFQHCSVECSEATRARIVYADTLCTRRGCGNGLTTGVRCPLCAAQYCSAACVEAHAAAHLLRCQLRVIHQAFMQSVRAAAGVAGESWAVPSELRHLLNRISPVVIEVDGNSAVRASLTCMGCRGPIVGDAHVGQAHGSRVMHVCQTCFDTSGWPVTECSRCSWHITDVECMLFGTAVRLPSYTVYTGYCGAECVRDGMNPVCRAPCPCGELTGIDHPCPECLSVYYCVDACRAADEDHELRCCLGRAYNALMMGVRRIAGEHGVIWRSEWVGCPLHQMLS
jgi:hypothetical protein